MKGKILKLLSVACIGITTFSVNSCCMIIFGQDKEPESLKRLKHN